MKEVSNQKTEEISLSLIDEPKGIVRMEIRPEYITELAQSLSELGLLQSVLLRPDGEKFEVVFGHCRVLAAEKLNWEKIRAVVRTMTDKEAAVARATENLKREDLTPIEEAATYKDMMGTYGMSVEDVGRMMGISAALVKKRVDLLFMPPQLQKALHEGTVSIGAAEELWGINDLTTLDYYLLHAVESGCTRQTAKAWRKEFKDAQRRKVSDVGGGGGVPPAHEPRPHYVTCAICLEPELIQNAESVMICKRCRKTIEAKQGET